MSHGIRLAQLAGRSGPAYSNAWKWNLDREQQNDTGTKSSRGGFLEIWMSINTWLWEKMKMLRTEFGLKKGVGERVKDQVLWYGHLEIQKKDNYDIVSEWGETMKGRVKVRWMKRMGNCLDMRDVSIERGLSCKRIWKLGGNSSQVSLLNSGREH